MKRTILLAAALVVLASSSWANDVHIVERGDTLFGIAREYGLTLDELLDANNLSASAILIPGVELTIPGLYTVEKGDTLFGIARQFGTSVDEIVTRNALGSTTIRAGQRIVIPGSNTAAPIAQANEPNRPQSEPTTPPTEDDAHTGSVDDRDAGASGNDAPDQRTLEMPRVSVAGELAEPISFDAGGIWPVVGERETLQGKFPGVLIRASRGASVQAIATGRVVYAGPHSSFGNVVFVQSTEGYVYVYGGQEQIRVSVGATVAAGDPLGTVGTSPGDGDGMYFSVWRDDEFVDPDSAPRG